MDPSLRSGFQKKGSVPDCRKIALALKVSRGYRDPSLRFGIAEKSSRPDCRKIALVPKVSRDYRDPSLRFGISEMNSANRSYQAIWSARVKCALAGLGFGTT